MTACKKFLLLVSLICSSFFAQASVNTENNSDAFFKYFDFFIPKNWEIKDSPHKGELTFLSAKHSCIIHINYDEAHFIKPNDRLNLSLNYQKALAKSLSATTHDALSLKIANPRSYKINNFDGYTFDYVNFFEDGRYLSGQSFLLFDKAKGALSVDINSINYKTRKKCLNDAKKYLKTLKTRKH